MLNNFILNHDTPIVACCLYKINQGGKSQRMLFRTQRWHVPSQNHEASWEKLRFVRSLYQNVSPNWRKKLRQHVGAMSWHHDKFHDFQASFGFTGILKPSFSMFSAEPRCPDVWNSFPFLAWDLNIHPRTPIWFFNPFWCTGACACSSNLNYAH